MLGQVGGGDRALLVAVVGQACAYPDLDGRDLEPTTEHRWLHEPRPVDD